MADQKCIDCPAPATTTVDEWRSSWGYCTLPVCETCKAKRQEG